MTLPTALPGSGVDALVNHTHLLYRPGGWREEELHTWHAKSHVERLAILDARRGHDLPSKTQVLPIHLEYGASVKDVVRIRPSLSDVTMYFDGSCYLNWTNEMGQSMRLIRDSSDPYGNVVLVADKRDMRSHVMLGGEMVASCLGDLAGNRSPCSLVSFDEIVVPTDPFGFAKSLSGIRRKLYISGTEPREGSEVGVDQRPSGQLVSSSLASASPALNPLSRHLSVQAPSSPQHGSPFAGPMRSSQQQRRQPGAAMRQPTNPLSLRQTAVATPSQSRGASGGSGSGFVSPAAMNTPVFQLTGAERVARTSPHSPSGGETRSSLLQPMQSLLLREYEHSRPVETDFRQLRVASGRWDSSMSPRSTQPPSAIPDPLSPRAPITSSTLTEAPQPPPSTTNSQPQRNAASVREKVAMFQGL